MKTKKVQEKVGTIWGFSHKLSSLKGFEWNKMEQKIRKSGSVIFLSAKCGWYLS